MDIPSMGIKFYPINSEKNMSRGCRDMSRIPLTSDEILLLKDEILRIKADLSIFIFNDERYIKKSTCYDFENDIVYVIRNVLPDLRYSYNFHPRDLMSPRAVLAHEYYGHRVMRNRYIRESRGKIIPVSRWFDEAYASIYAARDTPNLEQLDRVFLLNDAAQRAKEAGCVFELTPEMREMIHGYWSQTTKNIVPVENFVTFYRISGERRIPCRKRQSSLPKMR